LNMPLKDRWKSRKKTAWDRFAARIGKRLEKHQAEFEEMQRKYEQEANPKQKQKLEVAYREKIAPILTLAFFEELASISGSSFDKMMAEICKAMEEPLEQIGRDYLDYELMMRDPIAVLKEMFLIERAWEATRRELKKHEELFVNTELPMRLMELMTIRELSFGHIYIRLQPLFEILDKAGKRLGIDENWVTASFALSLEESLVKKKLFEIGVTKDQMKGSFHKLLEKTITLIEAKEGRRLPSDAFLSTGYRMIRNKLAHEGYLWRPTRKETNDIVRHVLRLSEALWKE
jgi:hypothetical protein